MSLPTSLLWINGSQRPSSTQQTYDVINSSSQVAVGRAAAASSEDAVAAILAAENAQPAWEALPTRARRDFLLKAAELLKTPKYIQLAVDAVHQETAALKSWGKAEIAGGIFNFQEAASSITKLHGEVLPSGRNPGGTVLVERRPFGVVFAMSPFNSPLNLAARAIAIPLICGNTVVLKSSELSPRSIGIIVEVLHEAGIPNGVLNLLHVAPGDAPRIVSEIIGNRYIRHINFTGSDRVGKIIAAEAAKHLKPCVLELGGKSSAVVLNDANIEDAARCIISSSMFHSGQICMSTERVIVQREISEAFITTLTTLARKIRSGTEESDHLSPLVSRGSAQRVLSLLTDAHTRGAEVILGDLKTQGSLLQPHIMLGIEPGWPLWEQETFAPVFGIKIVDTESEAIELANTTEHSLMASIWTRDVEKGLRLARKTRAGQVLLNGPTFAPEPGVGIHGLGGASGYGRFDVDDFTQPRIVVITPPGIKLPLVSDL